MKYKKGIKGLNRFNYLTLSFNFQDSEGGHSFLDERFRKKFDQGDLEVIFRFAQEDNWCFRSQWFVNQLEKWKLQGTLKDKNNLRKLFKCYLDQRGVRNTDTYIEAIERDQRVFKHIIGLKQKGVSLEVAFEKAEKELKISYREANKIWTEYSWKMGIYEDFLKNPCVVNPAPGIFVDRQFSTDFFIKFIEFRLADLKQHLSI